MVGGAIVNAVVHRSYSLAGDHIRVEIFEDRIEVMSPGRFPGLVAISDPLADRRLTALLPLDTRDVVAALRDAKRLSTMEVADRIGLSRPATLKRLNALKAIGVSPSS